jgi:predicted TIM-barrel fold metal-dependent hydrolase
MVLDHFCTPLGVGRFAGRRDELFDRWRDDIAEIARCDNVVAKLGGLAMPDNGFGWHTGARPPSSDEFVAAQGRYYLHVLDRFGADRCLFESNFPVDRLSLSYRTLGNAVKKMLHGATADERDAVFYGTATRVYRLDA